MKKLTTINDYQRLFLEDVPLLDVRAPIEFEKGSFPYAENYPITNNDERHLIGTYFKKYGREAAIEYGNKLVTGEVKVARLSAWKKFIDKNPNGALHCFRGGLRSHIAQQWIYEEFGINYPLVEEGGKALRNFLIEELESVGDWAEPIRIGGQTGVGKTKLLLKLDDILNNFRITKKTSNVIDLEGIANHRGSSFGKRVHPQPVQIDFENQLAVELLKRKESKKFKIILEDEGRNIGRVSIPQKTYAAFRSGPLVVLDIPVDERVNLTFDEYITAALSDYEEAYGKEKGFERWRENIETGLGNIQKRLGGAKYQELQKIVTQAMELQKLTSDGDLHKLWIKRLLTEYYDPMYDYHVAKADNEIFFKGNEEEVLNFLKKM